jgi:TrmH family RNA methyltransferase
VKTLTSLENPLVKSIRRLQQKPSHRADGTTVIEGLKLANEALSSGIEIAQALISVDLAGRPAGRALLRRLEAAGVPAVTVGERVLRRCSSLESPEGALLVGRIPLRPPDWMDPLTGELVLVVAGVQDPGNLGAMARVAEATGVSAMVVTRGTTHPFHPRALRGSMGSLLRLPIVDGGEPESVGRLLKKKGFSLAACVPRGGMDIREARLAGPLAIALGSEGSGLSKSLLKACDLRLSVPMKGSVDSLNVAVVAGLVLYEAARQRRTI